LMLRPILNVSVLGRIDNLKVIFGLWKIVQFGVLQK
jgi:hypothetical protein